MRVLIDVVIILAKGRWPLRGHDEGEDSPEKGLFLETVELIKRHCLEFQNYVDNLSKNCMYQSNKIQNNIIQSISNVVLRRIRDELGDLPLSLMADETPDIKHHEQLAVALRFKPNQSCIAEERFVALNLTQNKFLINWMKFLNVSGWIDMNFCRFVLMVLNKGSPKRHAIFEKITKSTDTCLKTLKSLLETGWACRAEAVAAIKENIISVI